MQKKPYRAIITVVGFDKPGIVAAISKVLAELNININDISQSFVQEFFTMILVVDLKNSSSNIKNLSQKLDIVETQIGINIQVLHEEIFKTMHRV